MTSRRHFLAQGLTGSILAAVPHLEAEAPPTVPALGPFTVRADASHASGPWILGGHYPVMAKVAGADTNGRFSLIQLVQPQNSGPALHIHPEQNEWFFVISGAIGVKLGEEKIVLKAGDSLMAPKGVPHAYVTLGAQDAHLLFFFDPAGDMEGHFAALARLKRLANGQADPGERAKAFADHGMRMIGPPPQASEFALA